MNLGGFDPVSAFNLLLERLDRIAEALEQIAVRLDVIAAREKK